MLEAKTKVDITLSYLLAANCVRSTPEIFLVPVWWSEFEEDVYVWLFMINAFNNTLFAQEQNCSIKGKSEGLTVEEI